MPITRDPTPASRQVALRATLGVDPDVALADGPGVSPRRAVLGVWVVGDFKAHRVTTDRAELDVVSDSGHGHFAVAGGETTYVETHLVRPFPRQRR
jgi:hypothetical protein